MKIALYGISGLYNFGCEAIVRGTVAIIRNKYPDAHIVYITPNAKSDKNIIKDLGIDVISDFPSKAIWAVEKSIVRAERKLDTVLKSYNRFLYKMQYQWVKEYDCILSIGGDIYTIGKDDTTNKGPFYLNLFDMAEVANDFGVPVVIWGASVGPFDSSQYKKKVFMEHFNKCIRYISARENNTVQYLKNNNYKECELYGDPAFAVPSIKSILHERFTIGINLSPLSSKSYYGNRKDEIVNKQVETIKKVADLTGAHIVLIAHVVSESKKDDDDFRYLKAIQIGLRDKGILVECHGKGLGFISIKDVIAKCDIVIAARMHCAINAITCGVPTLFISYSDKSKGMSKLVYGNEHFCISMDDFLDYNIVVNRVRELSSEGYNNLICNAYEKIRNMAFDSVEVLSRAGVNNA